MALEGNNADLALLLSTHLIERSPTGHEVSSLMVNHEEADTRLIMHCIHAHMETIVAAVRNTDVLLLLLAHYGRVGCARLYTKSGTSNAPKYVAVHETRMLLSIDLVDTLLSSHAITGCNSVSQFISGHGKKTA